MNILTRRDLGRLFAGTVAALPFILQHNPALADQPTVDEALIALVDPELRAIARQMLANSAKTGPLTGASLATLRSGVEQWIKPPLPGVTVEQRAVAVRGGPDVPVHVINARPGSGRPAILHTHGGGYVLGTPRIDIPKLQALAQTLDCVIVTVDYRLAPETRWPGSIEDTYGALKWLHDHAQDLGVDPHRIAVMGESAGGGHAAILAIVARDRGEVPVMFQCLIYPMLDDRTGSTRAVASPAGQIGWTAPDNRFGWRSFLGQEPGTPDAPVLPVPARVATVKGLPPAYIAVGALDLFLDEDIAYAQRLADAGIATELQVIPGAFHGFDEIGAGTAISARFKAAKIEALRRAFASAAGPRV